MGARRRAAYEIDGFKLGWRGQTAVAEFNDPKTGKRQRVRLGAAANEADGRVLLQRYAKAHKSAAGVSQEPTVKELWTAWMHDRERDGYSNAIYMFNWKALEPTFGTLLASSVTADNCRDYAKARFARGRAPGTVHTELIRLRHCLSWSEKRRLIERAPYVWVPQASPPRSLVLSPEEMLKLIEGAGEAHVRLFIILAVSTGARHMAILDLTWDRVDFEKGTVKYDDDFQVDPMSKSWRKGRATVKMNKTLKAELQKAFAGRQTDHVIEFRGKRLKSIRDGFKAAAERAELTDPTPTPHTIRHSVATFARAKGADIERVAHLLGHDDSDTTRLTYSHLDADFSSDVVEILDITPKKEDDTDDASD